MRKQVSKEKVDLSVNVQQGIKEGKAEEGERKMREHIRSSE